MIELIGEASVEDTLRIHKQQQAVPAVIKDLVEADLRIGKDVVASDIVMSQLTESELAENLAIDEAIKAAEIAKVNIVAKPKIEPILLSCTLSARLNTYADGFPGNYSIFHYTK